MTPSQFCVELARALCSDSGFRVLYTGFAPRVMGLLTDVVVRDAVRTFLVNRVVGSSLTHDDPCQLDELRRNASWGVFVKDVVQRTVVEVCAGVVATFVANPFYRTFIDWGRSVFTPYLLFCNFGFCLFVCSQCCQRV